MSETLNTPTLSGHWAVACPERNRRQLTLTLPEAASVRKFWKTKYPNCRVTIRPLTEAALTELYRLNGWTTVPAPQEVPCA